MAKIFTTVVKKIIQQAGGAINYSFANRWAVQLRTFLSAVLALLKPAYRVVQITYAYAGLYGATTATSATVAGNTQWTNPTNAQGVNNGTVATIAASATAAANANLTLTHAAVTNKTVFAITKVELVIHSSLTVGTLQTVTMQFRYSINGGTNYTQLFSRTAAYNTLVAGEAFDITAAIGGDYANLANIRTQVQGNLGTSLATGTASVDAVLLRVTTTPITQAA